MTKFLKIPHRKSISMMRLISIMILIFVCINDGFCTRQQTCPVADTVLIQKQQEIASNYINILPNTISEYKKSEDQFQISDVFIENVSKNQDDLRLFLASILYGEKEQYYKLSYIMDCIVKGEKNYDVSLGKINSMEDLTKICEESAKESNNLKICQCFSYIAETLEYGTLENTYNSINDVLKSEKKAPLAGCAFHDFSTAIYALSMKSSDNSKELNLLTQIEHALQIKDIKLPNPIYNIVPK